METLLRPVATAATLALLLLSACSHSRTAYEPETVTADPNIERLLVRLERAINEQDARGVCALYADPARLCEAIWRDRLRRWRVPVDLSLDKITGGCAGDARVSFLEKTSLGVRVSDLLYVRFHRGRRGRRGNYAESELREWAERIHGWPVNRVWLYFNNDWEAFAVRNAERLRELLDSVAESAYSGVDGTS